MLYQIDQAAPALRDGTLERAIKARDAGATVWIDASAGRVQIEGALTHEQTAEAFREAGLKVGPVAHIGSDCCGGCGG